MMPRSSQWKEELRPLATAAGNQQHVYGGSRATVLRAVLLLFLQQSQVPKSCLEYFEYVRC